ncbi:hypothetical protein Nos7524_0563 [Nostoc sp. PCC 7524]|nr:hypothetical protein [Nostoc sp. PCC 7524]AFY46474.1 hypothetical protein Nos7524_0563 [Nostoc sp. PCC 7524]
MASINLSLGKMAIASNTQVIIVHPLAIILESQVIQLKLVVIN